MVSTSRVCISYKNHLNFSLSFFFDAVPLVTIFLIPTHLSFRRTLLGQVEEEEDTSTPKKDSPKKMKAKVFTTQKRLLEKTSKQRKMWFKAGCCHITSRGHKKKKLSASFQTQDGVLHYQCLHLLWS